jgi:ribosome recycling factor
MTTYKTIQENLNNVKDWFKSELKTISAGVANPAVLDSIYIDSYGSKMHISHLSAIAVEDSKTLKISAWDKSQLKSIEQAIRDADLGLSLVGEGDSIRVIFPQLTTETRAKYTKLAKAKHEEARIKVRGIRSEVNSELDEMKKNGELSEDDVFRKKEDVQKKVDALNSELDVLLSIKEEALMTI